MLPVPVSRTNSRQRSISSSTDLSVPGEVVLGVDTHSEVHVAAVVSPLGKVLGTESFPATAAGYWLYLSVYLSGPLLPGE